MRFARHLILVLGCLAAVTDLLNSQTVTAGKRDSTVADSLNVIRKRLDRSNTKRDRNKLDSLASVSRVPHDAAPPVPGNKAPIAGFTLTINDTMRAVRTVSTSTDDGGTANLSYFWSWGDGSTSTAKGAAQHTYAKAGSYTVGLTVTDSGALASTATKSITIAAQVPLPDSIPPQPADTGFKAPELPRSIPEFQPKPCTTHKDIFLPMDLQAALNAAQPNDCLDLAPGQEWQGNFVLPARTCTATTGWTTIQTKGVTDVPGTRISQALGATFAKITNASNQYAIGITASTCNWQLVHLNIQRNPTYVGLVYHLLALGLGATEGNTSLATQPRSIIVRRSWIHGSVDGELVRCVVVNGINLAVVDSWIDDCHASGFDSQAVEGWNGAGPILISNNFLAGAGENVMFGGADPADSTLIPSDITITHNHFYKDLAWKGRWSIKNGLESKDSRRVLIDGNVFDPCSWASSQVGMCIVIKSSTGGMNSTLPQGTVDLTFTNNRTNLSNRGFNIQGIDCTAQACISYKVGRLIVQNNLFDSIGTSNGLNGQAWLNPISDGPHDILIRNNTFRSNLAAQGKATYLNGRQGEWKSIHWERNIFASQDEYIIGADCAQPTHSAALDCMIGAGNWTFKENVASGIMQTYWSKNPPGNTYKATIDELGLQPDGSAPLFPGIGADIAAIAQKTAGVVAPLSATHNRPRAAARHTRFRPSRADSLYMARQPRG